MNREILFGTGGLVIGVLISQYVISTSVNQRGYGMMQTDGRGGMMEDRQEDMMEEMHDMHMGSSMDEMMESMQGKSGDEFDQAFIDAMIVHHEGAVEMAEQAKLNAKHQEIKDMSDAIIEAQTNEINQMRMWLNEWGY